MKHPAVFFDKDGTLIENVPYNVAVEHIRFSANAVETCKKLQDKGYKIVIITNQSGVAKNYFTEKAFLESIAYIGNQLKAAGVYLDGFYYCPHHPEAVLPEYRVECSCRKPQPGLFLKAATALNIDLAASYMVGDILNDMEAGKRAGCTTVLLDNGNETEWNWNAYNRPDFRITDLAELERIILNNERPQTIEHERLDTV